MKKCDPLSPDLAAMAVLIEYPEPRRSAGIEWLRSRVAWEADCARVLEQIASRRRRA